MPLFMDITYTYFNPRSHERSDYDPKDKTTVSYDFNPRSHERSDFIGWSRNGATFISIHAPTRGATKAHTFHSLK